MHIAVKISPEQKEAFQNKCISPDLQITWADEIMNELQADAYFDFCFEQEGSAFQNTREQPVFVNAVVVTCNDLPHNYIRMNGWAGCWETGIVEIAALSNIKAAENILHQIGWRFQWIKDIPGMIVPRVLATIINEAYFALEEGVSSKAEIDTAMKLGTNYPFGPFEWGDKIGLVAVYRLLSHLSLQDPRYNVAPALKKLVPHN